MSEIKMTREELVKTVIDIVEFHEVSEMAAKLAGKRDRKQKNFPDFKEELTENIIFGEGGLGADSLDVRDIIVALEICFDIDILSHEEDRPGVNSSVGDLVEFLIEQNLVKIIANNQTQEVKTEVSQAFKYLGPSHEAIHEQIANIESPGLVEFVKDQSGEIKQQPWFIPAVNERIKSLLSSGQQVRSEMEFIRKQADVKIAQFQREARFYEEVMIELALEVNVIEESRPVADVNASAETAPIHGVGGSNQIS
jgi:acyl carrier protein